MIIVNKYPKSMTSESYRSLRTSLEYSAIDKKIKTLVITSSEEGEGKSTVAANLACILAQGEKRVILIDCDLRRPTIHRKFEKSNEKGLTEYLIGKIELSDVIKESCENLDIITAGKIPPNPAEVIGSKKMESLLERLKMDYDHIILDTPPVRTVTDGQVLAGKCDGTILVVRADRTKGESVIQGYRELEKVKARVLGTVINGSSKYKRDSYYYDSPKKRKKRKKFNNDNDDGDY